MQVIDKANVQVIPEIPVGQLWEGPVYLEGPTEDHPGILQLVDIVGGKIGRLDLETKKFETMDVGGKVGFAVVADDERIVAGVNNELRLYAQFVATKGEVAKPNYEVLAISPTPETIFNDAKCGPGGWLFAGTKNKEEPGEHIGSLYRLDAGRTLTEVVGSTAGHKVGENSFSGVNISNGIAFSPDGSKMYYNDSTDRIWIYNFDEKTGEISGERTFAVLPTDRGVPDGMTIDSKGNLHCMMWGGACVLAYSPDAQLIRIIETPSLQTSSGVFAGKDYRDLILTSANMNQTEEDHREHPAFGRVMTVRSDVPGRPEVRMNLERFLAAPAAPSA